jgi:hypothetical protein
MKQPLSKRSQPWVRIAVYSVMTTTVIIIVSLLMLVVLGYSFNQRDGRLEQGSLLQFGSTPNGATVILDELVLGARTNTKATVDAGSHSVDFNLAGYRTWKKTITVEPGQIGWVNYARLVPVTIEPEVVRTFEVVTSSMASPRDNWILIHEAADQPKFDLANIQGDQVRYTAITLPEDILTVPDEGKSQSFAIESWSQNEDAVLVRHSYNDGQNEWIYLDRDSPERSININTAFGINASTVVFAGDGDRLMFALTDGSVRRINLDDQTLSRPLASNVAQFSDYDEKMIIYTTTDVDGARFVGYATTDIPQPVVLNQYPADDMPLFADMETYFNRRYASILHGTQVTVVGGELPTLTNDGKLKTYASYTIPGGATELQMSRNGRFVVARHADGFSTYDLELKKYDNATWAYKSEAQRPLQWLDDYILWSDNGGNARIYDFDGANQQNIMPVIEGSAVTLNNNGKYIYGFTQNDKGISLSRAKMIIN